MRIVCKNDDTHSEFYTLTHVTQEIIVTNEGSFSEVTRDCIEVTSSPYEQTYTCAECRGEGVIEGEIVTLYATKSDEDTFSYIDIFDNEEDAKEEIGKIIDGEKITKVITGYSLRPVGCKYLYDDAPDFCHSVKEAVHRANELGIDLHCISPVK